MAEDMSFRNETSAIILLQAIANEWRNNHKTYNNPGDLMRTCLSKAGVSYLGPESLQIHMTLFRDLFTVNDSVLPCEVTQFGFCVRDYFEILCDEQLGWMSFLTEILPYLRLQKANNFLEKLVQFLRSFDDTSQTLAGIRLFLFSVSLVHSIMLDFLLASHEGTDASPQMKDGGVDSQPLKRSFNQHNQLNGDAQTMATHLRTCLESLLKPCCVEKLCFLKPHNINLFKQLVDNLILAIVFFNPYSTEKDASKLLLDSCVGQVVIPETNKKRNKNTMVKKDLNKSTISSIKRPLISNIVWTEVVLKQQRSRLKNEEQGKNVGKIVEADSTSDVEIQLSTCNILINCVLSHAPTTLFVDLICWFSQSDDGINTDFYKQLTDILFDCKDIFVGRHVLSGHILYPWFVTFLQDLVNASPVPKRTVTNAAELQTIISSRLLPDKIYDLSCLRMTEMGFILESRSKLTGPANIDLVCKAVLNKKNGWRDLLEMGLTNTDVNGWWRAGFFQLVWDNEAALSTEKNVRQMLHVLCRVAVEYHNSGESEFCNNVHKLFTIMFKRLPTLLQEQVILSTFISPNHDGPDHDLVTSGLHHLLKQGEIIEQLTPLLNRLTSAGVNKIVGHILYLCLFDADVVIQKSLQVAIENKAQVLPIVQVLHQISGICCFSEPKSNQSKLLFGLHEIISGTVINDNKANNIIQLLYMFTEKYILETVVDNGTHITRSMPGLLSQTHVFQHFICPSLDFFTEVTTRQQQEIQNLYFGNQAKNDQNNDLHRQTESYKETEVFRIEDEPEVHDEFVSDDLVSDVVIHLPLDVALRALSAVLDRVDLLDIAALKPFPLLIILADVYSRNCVAFRKGNLDRSMLVIKQACQKSITLLTSAVWKYSSSFTRADFLWLKQKALECGWLCTAVLKPVLNIGCDVQLHDILSSFTSQLMLQDKKGCGIRGLVVLIQLALINDEMLSDLMSVVKQAQLSAGHSQLVLALGCILTSSLTTEMYRLVNIIVMLLINKDKPYPVDDSLLLLEIASGCDACIHIQASQLLTDAVLQLSTSELATATWCHIVSNYQAAEQSLLQLKTPTFTLLVDVFCHCCTVLSVTNGQAAQLLQVLAMEVLTKLRACLCSTAVDHLDVVSGEERDRAEFNKGVDVISGYIECVCEDSVRVTLSSQLAHVM